MTTPTLRKVALLTSLYFAQGLPFGFFIQALPALMRENGASLPEISSASLLALPWGLKFLWAPLVDRHGGPPGLSRRRAWILPLQLLAAMTMAALALFPPKPSAGGPWAGMLPVLIGVFLTNLLAASQDIATDGLAVDLLNEDERGLGNGIQVAGYRVGMIAGGGLILMVLHRLGWAGSFLLMSALLLASTLPIFTIRDRGRGRSRSRSPSRSRDRDRDRDRPSYLSASLEFLLRPGAWSWLAILFIYKSGEALATGMLRTFLVDRHVSLADIGRIVGVVGFTTGLLGALAGGLLVNRLGRRRALIAFGLVQALTVAGYAAAAILGVSRLSLYLLCGLEHAGSGLATAALFTAMMDVSRPATGATDYTLQACVVVNATLLSAAISGFSAQALGYAGHFAVSALVCLLAVAAAAFLWPAWTRLHRIAQAEMDPMGSTS